MRQYKLDQEAFERLKKRGSTISNRLFFIVALFVIALLVWFQIERGEGFDYLTLPIIVPVLLGLAIGWVVSRRVSKKMYESVHTGVALTITENMITLEQFLVKPISVYHNEIREISKDAKGKIHIICNKATDSFVIPAIMQDMQEMEAQLSVICPITTSKSLKKHDWLGYFLIAAMVLGGAISLWSSVKDDADMITPGRILFFLPATFVLARLVFNKTLELRLRRIFAFFLFLFGVNSILAILKLLGYINF